MAAVIIAYYVGVAMGWGDQRGAFRGVFRNPPICVCILDSGNRSRVADAGEYRSQATISVLAPAPGLLPGGRYIEFRDANGEHVFVFELHQCGRDVTRVDDGAIGDLPAVISGGH